MTYTSNPQLQNLDLPFSWEGTPFEKGRFVNTEFSFKESFLDLLKWQTMRNPQKEEKKNDKWRLEVDFESGFLRSETDCIVWLGHASFFIRIAGVTMLIDPILYGVSLLSRQSALPALPESFENIDYILISHDHRDHCDEKSLKLLAKSNPDAIWLTGLNMESLLVGITGSKNIQAAGWYQLFNTKTDLKISYVPSRHWGKRLLNDTNLRLWGGFVIQAAGKTIYFCGDSGYDSHFKNISEIFPEIDFCMIGIGAYKPEFFMAQSHTSPADALKAFRDTKAKNMIPMHYGTFDLADEPIGDPVRVLKRLEAESASKENILFLRPGEMLQIS
jgi:L-ascorbate metabolism protein UlaG (beta-lactamase superfamily)